MKNLLILLAGLTYSALVSADASNELKRFSKCYGLFVRERISPTDSLWLQVQSGKKSGTEACMEIFDKAKLNSSGEIKSGADGYDYEGMRVLNTFLRFHISQLSIPNMGVAIDNQSRFTRDVVDGNEAAYHFLLSLFGDKTKYSDLVTRDYSLQGVRYSERGSRVRSVTGNVTLPARMSQGAYERVDTNGDGVVENAPAVGSICPDGSQCPMVSDSKSANPTSGFCGKDTATTIRVRCVRNYGGISDLILAPAETGILVGVRPESRDNTLTISPLHSTQLGNNAVNSWNINQHHGGGLMGTQAYLMTNLGKDGFVTGGTNLHRRWGKNILSDLLCRELPAVRSRDAIAEVDANSNIAYRTGISCMGCHASMDPLSGTVRNLRAVYSQTGSTGDRIKFYGQRNPDMAASPFPVLNADSSFYRRPAQGRLFYRSYDGALVDQDMEGLHDLGQIMAETNDLYVCAAKRYYKFLTGIDISLADLGDINTPAMSVGQTFQRNKVIGLGLELKKHQSLRTLIKKIIESEAFVNPERGV